MKRIIRLIVLCAEARVWFPEMAAKYHFAFDTTSEWRNLTASFLARYDVVIFLDTRPEDAAQRATFQRYMDRGGAWMGFHFAGFSLTPSAYPANWDWYHNIFLGAFPNPKKTASGSATRLSYS